MPDVQLMIEGTIYSGWKEVSVRRSLDLFADTFDLTLTDTQAGQARTIRLGSPCQVRIDGETIITGYVDRIRPRYDDKSRRITVSGRSKTADLVDCTLPGDELNKSQQKEQTLLQLAQFLGDYFGIEARSEVSDLPRIRIANVNPEQTLYEFLEIQARFAGVRLVSDAEGNLVLSRASEERLATALVLGENVREGEGEFSERDRFSEYFIAGQSDGFDDSWGETVAHVTGRAEDVNVRYRPTVVIAEGSVNLAKAQRRAEWQRNVHYGRSRQATYTVGGWHHKDGLWTPNTNVLVRDEWMGFTGTDGQGEWLMIGTVEFVFDAQGQRTRLTVMPREAYDLIPLPAQDGGEW